MTNILKKYSLRFSPLAYMALVWYQSAYFRPESAMHLSPWTLIPLGAIFEALHLVQFGILFVLLLLAARTFGPLTDARLRVAVWVSVAFAVSDEAHQAFVPFRSASGLDLLKDVVGILVCRYAVRTYRRRPDSRIGRYFR